MPIYEYQCQSCKRIIEVMQKFSDKPLSQCPNCHSNKIDKLISQSGFQLKGTGWYATDYKKTTSSQPSETESKPADKPAEKVEKSNSASESKD